MHPIKFLVATCLLYATLLVFGGTNVRTPEPAPTTSRPVVTVRYAPITTTSTTTSTTTTSTTVPQTAHDALQADLEAANAFALAELDPSLPCQEWAALALQVGWPADQLPTLLKTMWRESRCLPDADSGPDHGLTQINAIHEDWLADMGWTVDDLFDPETNLRFAYLLWSSREERGQCGWTPWSVQCP